MEDVFPIWKPRRATRKAFEDFDFRQRYKALRNSSSAFIKRRDVRDFIMRKYGGKCYLCGNTEKLQIDHIISVYQCAYNKNLIDKLNAEKNLALICLKCNSSKQP